MARVHHLKSSRVEHACHRGHTIPAGEPYSWAAPGFRARKKFACKRHPFRASDLTTSMAAEALAAQEEFQDALDAIDTGDTGALELIDAARQDLEQALDEYTAQRQEALDAWENGNSQLEELLDTAQAALDEVQSFSVQPWDGDEEARDDEDHPDHEEAVESWNDHVQEQIDEAANLAELDV